MFEGGGRILFPMVYNVGVHISGVPEKVNHILTKLVSIDR